MLFTIISVSILLILAALCNRVMDTLKDHFADSIFRNLPAYFWDANQSWKNKFVDRDPRKERTHWLLFAIPRFNFVGIKVVKPAIISDAWHLSKFVMQLCIANALGILTVEYIGLPLFFAMWYLGFEVIGILTMKATD
jgi:hypothetical protein